MRTKCYTWKVPTAFPQDRSRGVIFGLASGLAFGLMGFLGRYVRDGLPAQEVAFFRAAVSVVVLLPFCATRLPVLFSRVSLSLWLRSIAERARYCATLLTSIRRALPMPPFSAILHLCLFFYFHGRS